MRSRFYYLRCLIRDALRYGRLSGCLTSRALAGLARLRRDPIQRLALLTRAARLEPTRKRLLHLKPGMDSALDMLSANNIDWKAAGAAERNDMGKGIILKPYVSPREKGVLYLTFEKQWLRLLRTGKVHEIASQYDVVLGPSSSPPPHVEMLLMAKLWPGPVFSILGNLADAELLKALSPKLIPLPLLASSWIVPEDFTLHLSRTKDHDIVMLAHFDPVKRHWLLFEALRKLPRACRVLLMGLPLGGRDENDLMREARTFGVEGRFDLLLRPSRAEVMAGLARSRVSLVFSRQEGACIAVSESLFANTPVGLFRDARIGSKAFINDQTGRLLDYGNLARQLQQFVEEADTYQPREWALANISCHVSRAALNRELKQASLTAGREWTRDVLPFRKDLVPSYLFATDEAAMRPEYERFAEQFGLLLGPAAKPGWLKREMVACMGEGR